MGYTPLWRHFTPAPHLDLIHVDTQLRYLATASSHLRSIIMTTRQMVDAQQPWMEAMTALSLNHEFIGEGTMESSLVEDTLWVGPL